MESSKHLIPDPDEEQNRLAQLRGYDILDESSDPELDIIVKLASELCDTPISLVTLIDQDRQWFKASKGIEGKGTARQVAFCDYTIRGDEVFEVEDASTDGRFSKNPLVTDDPGIRFYAGAPLITPEGYKLGALCVIDKVPRKLTAEQKQKLQSFSKLVINQFELRRKKREVEITRNFYHSILASSGDIIYTADYKGNFQFISAAVRTITGYTPEELKGKHFTALVAPAFRQYVEQFYLKQFRDRKSQTLLEFCITTKSGELKWVEQGVSILEVNGKVSFQGIVRDIQQRKTAEEELIKAKKIIEETHFMLQSILDNTSAVIYIKNLRHEYIMVNKQFEILFDLSFETIKGKTDYDFREEKVARSLRQSDREVTRKKRPLDFEYSFFIRNLKRSFIVRKFPVYNAEGEMYGICGVYTEITAQKRVQELLREKDRRFSKIFHNSPAAMILSTIEPNKIVEVNPSFTAFTGYTQDFISGKNTAEIGMIDEETRVAALAAFRKKGVLKNYEVTLKTKNGEFKTALMSTEQVQLEGKQHALSLYYDITERIKIENELSAAKALLTEAMSIGRIGNFENDIAAQRVSWSKEVFEIMDMQATDKPFTYEEYIRCVHPEDLNFVLGKIAESFKNKKPDVTVNRFITPRGNVKWIETRVVPVIGNDGEITCFRGTMQDITEQKETEMQLREAKQLAEQSALAKEQFLANMSHEIRTPLNGLLGFTELLHETKLNARQLEYLKAIRLSGNNLLTVINDILDYSKIEAGMMVFEDIEFSMVDVLDNIVLIFKSQARSKKIGFERSLTGEANCILVGDPSRLAQVLNNLVGNAIKFTSKGKITVSVDIAKPSEEGRWVTISVKDTGTGIKKELHEAIFERFNQGSNDTSRKFGGTGLGLSIVKKLVELQGGNISVKSAAGKGSEFTVKLPFKSINKSNRKKQDQSSQSTMSVKNLLLVEDHPVNRKLIGRMLENSGITVDMAENGKEALLKLKKKRYDVVLMDIQMPEMDGYEATKQIREKMKLDVPVIALTAHALSTEKDKCLAMGMNDYLPKPISKKLLFEKLGQIGNQEKEMQATAAESAFSMAQLLEISGGDVSFIREILGMFVKIIPDELNKIATAIAKKDLETLRLAAHKLKSPLPLVGLNDTLTLLNELEMGTDLDRASEIYSEVQKICDTAIVAAQKQLKKYS